MKEVSRARVRRFKPQDSLDVDGVVRLAWLVQKGNTTRLAAAALCRDMTDMARGETDYLTQMKIEGEPGAKLAKKKH